MTKRKLMKKQCSLSKQRERERERGVHAAGRGAAGSACSAGRCTYSRHRSCRNFVWNAHDPGWLISYISGFAVLLWIGRPVDDQQVQVAGPGVPGRARSRLSGACACVERVLARRRRRTGRARGRQSIRKQWHDSSVDKIIHPPTISSCSNSAWIG